MNVRPARNADEVWLLDKLEEVGIDDPGFRSRDYVIAMTDEEDPCGAGRIWYRTTDSGTTLAELGNLVTFADYQGPSPTAALVSGLAEKVAEEDVEYLYSTDPPHRIQAFDGHWDTHQIDGEEQEMYLLPVDAVLESSPDGSNTDDRDDLADEFGYDEETTTKYSID